MRYPRVWNPYGPKLRAFIRRHWWQWALAEVVMFGFALGLLSVSVSGWVCGPLLVIPVFANSLLMSASYGGPE